MLSEKRKNNLGRLQALMAVLYPIFCFSWVMTLCSGGCFSDVLEHLWFPSSWSNNWATGARLLFNHSAVHTEIIRFLVLSTKQLKRTQFHHTRLERSNSGDFMIVCMEGR
jgi:hypothetical protein